jgi:hypothetical protein
MLGGKCVRCSYDRCIWALEFHHPDPNSKTDDFLKKTRGGIIAWERFWNAVKDCELICANCHREEHFLNGCQGRT